MIRSIFIFLVLLLLVSQVVVSNHLVSAGKSTVGIDEEIRLLESENEILRQQVAAATSLLAVETKAAELGFTTHASTITLTPPNIAYNSR